MHDLPPECVILMLSPFYFDLTSLTVSGKSRAIRKHLSTSRRSLEVKNPNRRLTTPLGTVTKLEALTQEFFLSPADLAAGVP